MEEGLLDPLLQYLVKPTGVNDEYTLNISTDEEAKQSTDDEDNVTSGRMKITDGSTEENASREVVITVRDEVKNKKKLFYCPQGLLKQKMGYFR